MNETSSTISQPLELMTAREAAKYLRVSLSTLYRMEQEKQITPLRTPGGHRRYTVEMLNACLLTNKEAQTDSQESKENSTERSYA